MISSCTTPIATSFFCFNIAIPLRNVYFSSKYFIIFYSLSFCSLLSIASCSANYLLKVSISSGLGIVKSELEVLSSLKLLGSRCLGLAPFNDDSDMGGLLLYWKELSSLLHPNLICLATQFIPSIILVGYQKNHHQTTHDVT